MLMVFALDEAEAVHAAAPTTPILVMMPTYEIELGSPAHGMLLRGMLHCVAHDAGQVRSIERSAEALGVRLPLHIEVDTGLGRGGSLPEEALKLAASIQKSAALSLSGAFTHYANAGGSESATDMQRERLNRWVTAAHLPEQCVVHSASTFAAIRDGRFHHQMVRVGLGWTGLAFEGTRDGKHWQGVHALRPVFNWQSRVMQVRRLPQGATVGYGSRWVARAPSVVGFIPVGYADGYPLLPMDPRTMRPPQAEQRSVRVRVGDALNAQWLTVPVIGAVSMDQIAVDLTTAAAQLPDGGLHGLVEMISADQTAANHVVRVAAMTGQHAYEFMCGIPARVPRVYVAAQQVAPHAQAQSQEAASARQAS